MPLTYAGAGVNIDEGDRFVKMIKGPVRSTFSKDVLRDIGAFGAFYNARFRNFKSPVLVSSVDGVGTKLLIAQKMNKHDTVGQDLVNHCVNDILVCGASPLFFLDYFATGKLSAEIAGSVVSGFVRACRENGCSLVGGETAEMPGMYADDEYDLAGTIVGVVERSKIVDGHRVRKGDILIGLPSNGLHTNGYSLARAVLLKDFTLEQHLDELGSTVGEALLAIHRSYMRAIRPLLRRFTLHGLSHITGGGIEGNTVRVVPKGRTLKLDWSAWKRPSIFQLIQDRGSVPEDDMRRTFNLGIGLIIIAAPKDADAIMRLLRKAKEESVVVGEIG